MSVMRNQSRKLSAGVAAAALLFIVSPAGAQTVGKTAAVNPSALGAGGRTLTLGAEVVHKERIKTSGNGSLQLLFLDRTTLNIGPNSDVVIDDYVFDPKTNAGKMSVSLGKGLMRFVGGQISHDGNASVSTPSALIGIRGAVGYFSYDPQTKLTTASNDCQGCSITIFTPGGQQVTIPPGNTAMIGADGKTTIAPTTPEQAARDLAATTSKTGQNGGRSGNPQDNWNAGDFSGYQSPGGVGTATGTDWILEDLTKTLQTTIGNNTAGKNLPFPSSPPPPPPPPPPPCFATVVCGPS